MDVTRGAGTLHRRLAIACVVAAVSCPAVTHAELSERSFVGNFIGYSAQPENYFSISGATNRASSSGAIYLEKTLSPDSSFSIFAGLQRIEQDGESSTGWNNIDVAYKHVLISHERHEFVLSISPYLELPTGNSTVGAETHVREGFELLFAKGFGDLSEALTMLRPGALEGDVSWEGKLTGVRDDLVSADAEIEYSFPYLDQSGAGSRFSHALKNFTPNIDFDYSQYMDAHRNSTAPGFLLTPAIAWLNSTFEVNLGAQIALNHASSGEGAVAFVWQVGVSYDRLIPAAGWNPFH
jgi:hypothetical protein